MMRDEMKAACRARSAHEQLTSRGAPYPLLPLWKVMHHLQVGWE